MICLLSRPAGRNVEGMNDVLCRRGRAIGCRISSDAAVEHEAEHVRCRSTGGTTLGDIKGFGGETRNISPARVKVRRRELGSVAAVGADETEAARP